MLITPTQIRSEIFEIMDLIVYLIRVILGPIEQK